MNRKMTHLIAIGWILILVYLHSQNALIDDGMVIAAAILIGCSLIANAIENAKRRG